MADEELDIAEVPMVGQLMDMARNRIDRIAATRDGLRGAEPAACEIGNGDLVRGPCADGARSGDTGPLGVRLREAWPSPTDAWLGREALAVEVRDGELDAALKSGAAIRLDPEEQTTRIALGGTLNSVSR